MPFTFFNNSNPYTLRPPLPTPTHPHSGNRAVNLVLTTSESINTLTLLPLPGDPRPQMTAMPSTWLAMLGSPRQRCAAEVLPGLAAMSKDTQQALAWSQSAEPRPKMKKKKKKDSLRECRGGDEGEERHFLFHLPSNCFLLFFN